MNIYLEKRHKSLPYRILSAFIAFTFAFSLVLPPGYAQLIPQTLLNLPAPGTMVSTSAAFTPALINGITIHPENPLEFDFIVGAGDENLEGKAFEEESTRLIKYFLASLTVPEDQMWVNLSPYEKDRIVPQGFGQTEMGRDLLAQDYILKQLTASLMYPEKELGQKFWDKIYKKAKEQFGTAEIPMNTFNKVWIVPQKAVVYEHGNSAFVVKSHLKVMLEEDYLAANQGTLNPEPRTLSPETEIIREIILPAIEQEVNEGKTFTNLRQIYNSVILAAWFKQNLKQTLLGQVYVDKTRTKGIDVEDKEVNRKIYARYLEAFKKGVYNYIKEDTDPATQEIIPRKYFSGGIEFPLSKKIGNKGVTLVAVAALLTLTTYTTDVAASIKKFSNDSNVKINLVELSGKKSAAEVQNTIAASRSTSGERQTTEQSSSPVALDAVSLWIEKTLAGEENVEVPAVLLQAEKQKRAYIIGGNLKMNRTPTATGKLIRDMAERIRKVVEEKRVSWSELENIDIVIAPSFTSLPMARKTIDDVVREEIIPAELFQLGAQNVSGEAPGAQTGEESVENLQDLDLGVTYVILGHSERRRGPMLESSELVNRKAKRVLEHGLTPIIALGETLNEYKEKRTYDVIADQFSKSTAGIEKSGVVIAYEPVWAIGTGLTPTPEEANKIQRFIRALAVSHGLGGASMPIQYGGSMKPDNVGPFIAQLDIDGGLIGNAALKADDFIEIVVKSLEHYLSSSSPVLEFDPRKISKLPLELPHFGVDSKFEGGLDQLAKQFEGHLKIENAPLGVQFGAKITVLLPWEQQEVSDRSAYPSLFDYSKPKFIRYEWPGKVAQEAIEVLAEKIKESNLGKDYEVSTTLGPGSSSDGSDGYDYVSITFTKQSSSPVLAQSMPVSTPEFFANALKGRGFRVKGVEVAALKLQGGATVESVLNQPYVKDAVSISIAQALGSILFAGQGDKAKVPSDSNAVGMGHESLVDMVTRNPNIAIADIASEGIRDGSVGTPLGRIYWSGYENKFRDSADKADYEAQLTMFRERDLQILYLLDDALENTNALKDKDALIRPTDAWSAVAFQIDDGVTPFRHMLDEKKTRRLSVMANAPGNAGLTALDSPREALKKLAAANGISQLDSPEGRVFAKKIIMAVLSERKEEDTKKSSSRRHHAFYLEGPDGIQALQREYGVRFMEFGDGDLVPGLLAAAGIKLDDAGSIVAKFGRSGLVEGEIMELGASQIDGAQYAARAVSNETTDDRVNPETALKVQDGLLSNLVNSYGYLENTFQVERTKDGRLRGKGIVAMTAVTGADPNRYLSGFAGQLNRVNFDEGEGTEGTVALNTFLISQDGVFAVRTTLESDNLQQAKSSISSVSPEAKVYLAALKALENTEFNETLNKAKWGDADQKNLSRKQIEKLSLDKGLVPASMYDVYQKMVKGEIRGVTVPAINVRTDTLEQMRRIFRLANKHDIGLFILELALSEKGYTAQTPETYKIIAYIAAMMEGYQGPVYLQADHYQIKADKYAESPHEARQAISKAIEEAVKESHFGIDLDNSVLVALSLKQEFEDLESESLDAPQVSDKDQKIRDLAENAYTSWEAVLGREKMEAIKQKVMKTLKSYEQKGFYSDIVSEINTKLTQEKDDNKAKALRNMRRQIEGFRSQIIDPVKIEILAKELLIQQMLNAQETAQGTMLIRGLEPEDITVAIGGEIGEVGSKNSEPGEFVAYLELYNEMLSYMGAEHKKTILGLSKVAIQTGTSHGVGGDIDFRTMKTLAELGREYGVVVVQHGASNVSTEKYGDIVKNGAGEVHLATAYMGIAIEHLKSMPQDSEGYAIYQKLEDLALQAKNKGMKIEEINANRAALAKKLKIADYRNGLKEVQQRIDNLPVDIHKEMGDKFEKVMEITLKNLGAFDTFKYAPRAKKNIIASSPVAGKLEDAEFVVSKTADSRDRGTPQVELRVGDLRVTADVPAGASKGEDEAHVTDTPEEAIENIWRIIVPMLKENNLDLNKHEDLVRADRLMIEKGGDNFKALGANATVPVSRSLWLMAAKLKGISLAAYIAQYEPEAVFDNDGVYFYMNIFNGGLHALKKGENLGVDRIPIQEVMVALKARTYREALVMGDKIDAALKRILVAEFGRDRVTRADEAGFSVKGLGDSDKAIAYVFQAVKDAGYNPGYDKKSGRDVRLALDVAATTFDPEHTGTYDFMGPKTQDEMIAYYEGLNEKYRGLLLSVEDGLGENDWNGWQKITASLKPKGVKTIGDDLFVTQLPRFRKGVAQGAADVILIKVNQNGTMTGTLDVMKEAKRNGYQAVVSHRSGETMDTTIADLAYGTNAFGLKTGDPQPGYDFGPGGEYAGQAPVRRVKYERMVELQSASSPVSREDVDRFRNDFLFWAGVFKDITQESFAADTRAVKNEITKIRGGDLAVTPEHLVFPGWINGLRDVIIPITRKLTAAPETATLLFPLTVWGLNEFLDSAYQLLDAVLQFDEGVVTFAIEEKRGYVVSYEKGDVIVRTFPKPGDLSGKSKVLGDGKELFRETPAKGESASKIAFAIAEALEKKITPQSDVGLIRSIAESAAQGAASSPVAEEQGSPRLRSGLPSVAGDRGQTTKKVGGINLNPALLDLQIRRDANGVPLPLPMQPIEHMHIEGFLPVIINVTPVSNLPLLLGIVDDQLPADSADSGAPPMPMELSLAVREDLG